MGRRIPATWFNPLLFLFLVLTGVHGVYLEREAPYATLPGAALLPACALDYACAPADGATAKVIVGLAGLPAAARQIIGRSDEPD